ncbi:ShlA/HecA/FhaA protein, partial [Cronobacter dublinensis subsp. dublinensis]|nr:ShlA/HecA/FhaA protein [Cronobacter dublinensis subsp. dublinensis]
AAPYLAEQVKKQIGEDNIAANAVAHAIVGGIVAELSGRNGLAGAAGAASGELAAKALMTELYPGKTASQLSEEEKQTLSALSTLAAGLAGGVVGDSSDSAFTGAQAGKNAVENNHLNTLEKLSLSNKKKEYSSSCQGENADNESCKALKQDIDKLNEKGQSIDKTEYSELGPDFQLGGVDSIKHTPGEVVSCVGSSNGYCTVTDVSAVDGKEWKLEPANQVQAITEKYKNEKTEDFIKALGAAYFEGGCGMPGVASALCQSYSAFGGANPISGKVPTDAERITWALNAAANVAAGVKTLKDKSGNPHDVTITSANISTGFTKNPQSIWGRSANAIVEDFQSAGYQANVRHSTRGSGQAIIIEIKGHPEISQIQYHPGGGRHGGSYYKVSTTTQGTVKVVDPATYKPTPGEKATIINKPRE